jgi:hypothetical protein
LLGVAALMIASKFEEVQPPTGKDLEYVTDGAYSRQEIIEMEQQVLSALDYNVLHHSPLRFLDRYIIAVGAEQSEAYLAHYLLELAQLDSKMNQFTPSLQAASALHTARKLMGKSGKLGKIELCSGYSGE